MVEQYAETDIKDLNLVSVKQFLERRMIACNNLR